MATALVTGGNRGIGRAIVKGLAQQGFDVLLACRDQQSGLQAAQGLGEKVFVVKLDLASPPVLEADLQNIVTTCPRIDVLVNNAGVLEQGDALNVNAAQLQTSMQVNCFAPLLLAQRLMRSMNQRGYGRIVNISSGWGSFSEGFGGPCAYSLSKAALNAATVELARCAQADVLVNSMCPGWVRTDMGGPEADRTPEQGAETALWLATLPAGGPNGQFFRDKQPIRW